MIYLVQNFNKYFLYHKLNTFLLFNNYEYQIFIIPNFWKFYFKNLNSIIFNTFYWLKFIRVFKYISFLKIKSCKSTTLLSKTILKFIVFKKKYYKYFLFYFLFFKYIDYNLMSSFYNFDLFFF